MPYYEDKKIPRSKKGEEDKRKKLNDIKDETDKKKKEPKEPLRSKMTRKVINYLKSRGPSE